MAIGAIGIAAGTLTTLSFVPQLLLVLRTRTARDISYSWLALFATGIFLWEIYGLLIWSWPVILANLVTLALVAAILVLKVSYERHGNDRATLSGTHGSDKRTIGKSAE